MEFKPENFDKEFSLNKNTPNNSKKSPLGKIPSWLMILAGAAVIGGVVAAQQPAIRPTENSVRASVIMPTSQVVSGDTLTYTGVNDQKADLSELEARFASGLTVETETAPGAAVSEPTAAPQSEAEPTDVPQAGTESTDVPQTAAEPTNTPAVSALPNQSTSNNANTEPAAEESTPKAIDAPAIVRMNDTLYEVTVKPLEPNAETENTEENAEETAQQNGSGNALNLPVTVLDAEGNPKKDPVKSVFTVDDKQYEMEITELTAGEIAPETPEQPIVWLDEIPLQVGLTADPVKADGEPVEISLNPLSSEQTAALQRERFGESFTPASGAKSVTEPTAEPTATPTPAPTEVPADENWFVNLFNGIFGSNPTAEPTPEVTVIPLTPTPTTVPPTATPIVVRVEPTATAQGPVRLDGEPTAAPLDSKTGDLDDPALVDDEENNTVNQPAPTRAAVDEPEQIVQSEQDEQADQTQQNETTNPVQTEPQRLEVTVVEEFETKPTTEAAAQSEQEELPHTGMAEGWNIPSMLGLLAGLLLIIIGVRKLRTK